MLNKIKQFLLIFMISLVGNNTSANYEKLAYDFAFKDLNGSELNLAEFKDKVIIVVNVASQCGFTKQYEDMQKVWEKYQSKGIIMLGVPSNDFGNQEPGSSKDIKNFCEAKFGITFPMTEKVVVKGENAHPFYKWAKENHGKSAITKWNFHKFIIGRRGKIVGHFPSDCDPVNPSIVKCIEQELIQK